MPCARSSFMCIIEGSLSFVAFALLDDAALCLCSLGFISPTGGCVKSSARQGIYTQTAMPRPSAFGRGRKRRTVSAVGGWSEGVRRDHHEGRCHSVLTTITKAVVRAECACRRSGTGPPGRHGLFYAHGPGGGLAPPTPLTARKRCQTLAQK